MFESLGDRLQNAVNKIKGYGKITEDNISEVTREIRLALLEADVNYKVVKEFINNVKEKALGEEVTKSLKPGEQFVKILKDELVVTEKGYGKKTKITEYRKTHRGSKGVKNKVVEKPEWFNKNIDELQATEEEIKALEARMKKG